MILINDFILKRFLTVYTENLFTSFRLSVSYIKSEINFYIVFYSLSIIKNLILASKTLVAFENQRHP